MLVVGMFCSSLPRKRLRARPGAAPQAMASIAFAVRPVDYPPARSLDALSDHATVAGKAVITPAPVAPVVAGTDAEFDAAAVGAEIHLRGRRGSRHQRADRRCCEKKLSHADLLFHRYPIP